MNLLHVPMRVGRNSFLLAAKTARSWISCCTCRSRLREETRGFTFWPMSGPEVGTEYGAEVVDDSWSTATGRKSHFHGTTCLASHGTALRVAPGSPSFPCLIITSAPTILGTAVTSLIYRYTLRMVPRSPMARRAMFSAALTLQLSQCILSLAGVNDGLSSLDRRS